MKTPHKAKTIRLTEQDKQAVAAIRVHYGLTSDNEAIRFALSKLWRELQPAFEKEPLKQERSRKRGKP